jgi:hypothetical protein
VLYGFAQRIASEKINISKKAIPKGRLLCTKGHDLDDSLLRAGSVARHSEPRKTATNAVHGLLNAKQC